jgi:hypothetical protein
MCSGEFGGGLIDWTGFWGVGEGVEKWKMGVGVGEE